MIFLAFSMAALSTKVFMLDMPVMAAACDNRAWVSRSTLAVIRGGVWLAEVFMLKCLWGVGGWGFGKVWA